METTFKCPECSRTTNSEQSHYQHLRDSHQDNAGYEEWQKKNQSIFNNTTFKCPTCNIISKNEQGYWQHQRDRHDYHEGYNNWHEKQRSQKTEKKREEAKNQAKEICDDEKCDAVFPNIGAKAQHMKDVHKILLDMDTIFDVNEKDDFMKKSFEDFVEKSDKLGKELEEIRRSQQQMEQQTAEEYVKKQNDGHRIAWSGLVLIESLLKKIAKILKFDKPGGTYGNYLSYLKLVGFVGEELYSSLWDLKMLRNVVSHSTDVIVNISKTEKIMKTFSDLLLVIKERSLQNSFSDC